jgi:hypothetical protein
MTKKGERDVDEYEKEKARFCFLKTIKKVTNHKFEQIKIECQESYYFVSEKKWRGGLSNDKNTVQNGISCMCLPRRVNPPRRMQLG